MFKSLCEMQHTVQMSFAVYHLFIYFIIAPVQLARLAAHTKTVKKTVSLSGKSVSPLSNHNLIMKDISEYCLLPAYWHVHSKVNAKSHPIQYCVFL